MKGKGGGGNEDTERLGEEAESGFIDKDSRKGSNGPTHLLVFNKNSLVLSFSELRKHAAVSDFLNNGRTDIKE